MNEIFIREKLQQKLAREHKGTNTEFLSELPVANFSRRIDLVMANGKLSGFEIKSEQDTLKRLEGQLEVYTQYFEDVVVVCATKHLQGVMDIAPENVGVWEFNGKKFIIHRKPLMNKALESEKFLSFLNVIGLKELLRENNVKVSGLKSELISRALKLERITIRSFILDYLKKQFPLIIQEREEFKSRKKSKNIAEVAEVTINNRIEESGILLNNGQRILPQMPQELLDLPIRERLLAIRHYRKNHLLSHLAKNN